VKPPSAPTSKPQAQTQTPKVDQQNATSSPPPLGGKYTTNIAIGSIIGACVVVFVYQGVKKATFVASRSEKDERALIAFYKNMILSLDNILEGRYWTALTHTLTHNSLMHLGFNMIALWSFGRPVIAWYGIPTFAILYIGSAITGTVLQVYLWDKKKDYNSPYRGAAGASGAVAGLVMALTCVTPRIPFNFFFIDMPMWAAAAIGVGVSIGGLTQGWLPGIGHGGHLGGMAFGAFWWFIAIRRGRFGAVRRTRYWL